MRWMCALVFLVAAGGSVLAASGLAVPPHIDPPGTPRSHDHLLVAYRYPLFLLRLRVLSQHANGPSWTLETPGSVELGALTLATLALSVPRLPRPTRRVVAMIAAIVLRAPQWRLGAPLAPPRAGLLTFT